MSRAEEANPPRALPVLKTPRLTVRLGSALDVPGIVAYFERNRGFFSATDPYRPPEFFRAPFWQAQVDRSVQEFYRDQAVRFFVFQNGFAESASEGGRVLGAINFSNLFRGPFQACYLGYGLDENAQGQGYMTEALEAAIAYVFDELKLHRIMANHLPGNERSAAVLKRLGFSVEGLARDYLLIGGEWRDHVLTSLVNPSWSDPARPAARPELG